MKQTMIRQLRDSGQVVWIEADIRSVLKYEGVGALIAQGITGIMAPSAIVTAAVEAGSAYEQDLRALGSAGASAYAAYETVTAKDTQAAADALLTVYSASRGDDGYVTVDVNPRLAHNAPAMITEARRLFQLFNRPNVMVTIPATESGILALEALIAEGRNVNAALVCSRSQYYRVAQAYINGMRRLSPGSREFKTVRSVATVLISRLDALADPLLRQCRQEYPKKEKIAAALLGGTAITHAANVYSGYSSLFEQAPFAALRQAGAAPQRLVWMATAVAATAATASGYDIAALSAPDTVTLISAPWLAAAPMGGGVTASLNRDLVAIRTTLNAIAECGVNIEELCEQLFVRELVAVQEGFSVLLAAIERLGQRVSYR